MARKRRFIKEAYLKFRRGRFLRAAYTRMYQDLLQGRKDLPEFPHPKTVHFSSLDTYGTSQRKSAVSSQRGDLAMKSITWAWTCSLHRISIKQIFDTSELDAKARLSFIMARLMKRKHVINIMPHTFIAGSKGALVSLLHEVAHCVKGMHGHTQEFRALQEKIGVDRYDSLVLNGGQFNYQMLSTDLAIYICGIGREYDKAYSKLIKHDSHRYGYVNHMKEKSNEEGQKAFWD